MKSTLNYNVYLTATLLLSLVTSASADEGMWLFNDLPKQLLQEKYDFTDRTCDALLGPIQHGRFRVVCVE